MTKLIFKVFFFSLFLIITACYTDDSSTPSPDRLPFEDFNDFFQQNNTVADTFTFNSDQASTLNTSSGAVIEIPEDAFSLSGNISVEVKEATSKSDFIFLNKPTVDGDNWIEASNSIFIKPFVSTGMANIDNPLNIQLDLPNGTTGENMEFYYFENGWNKDNSFAVEQNSNTISFETEQAKWQIGGKVFESANTNQLTINPVGYGSIPHDMVAFIVLTDYNVVLPMTHDLSTISASAQVPAGVDFHVVAMVMDHFKLSVAVEPFNIDSDMNVELPMDTQSADEMRMSIKGID